MTVLTWILTVLAIGAAFYLGVLTGWAAHRQEMRDQGFTVPEDMDPL